MNTQAEQVSRLLYIVGTEDGTDKGAEGRITVEGALGREIMKEVQPLRAHWFDGKPVRVSREGGKLEICCDGWYLEGRGVRAVVHTAIRQTLKTTTQDK